MYQLTFGQSTSAKIKWASITGEFAQSASMADRGFPRRWVSTYDLVQFLPKTKTFGLRGRTCTPVLRIYFFSHHSTEICQICQNKVEDEKLDCAPFQEIFQWDADNLKLHESQMFAVSLLASESKATSLIWCTSEGKMELSVLNSLWFKTGIISLVFSIWKNEHPYTPFPCTVAT